MTADQLKYLIHNTAAHALSSLPADEEAAVLQSTIGVVNTLIADNRLAELAVVLSVNFANYYPANSLLDRLIHYPTTEAN